MLKTLSRWLQGPTDEELEAEIAAIAAARAELGARLAALKASLADHWAALGQAVPPEAGAAEREADDGAGT